MNKFLNFPAAFADRQKRSSGAHLLSLDLVFFRRSLCAGLIAALAIFVMPAQAQGLFTLPDNPLLTGYITGTALLNQTGDRLGTFTPLEDGTFFDVSGNKSRYNTGSHVDVTSVSLLTGMSRQVKLTRGQMTIGAFFEYGNGDYDTFNSLDATSPTQYSGGGNVHHVGGGVLGRMNFRHSGFYTEGSFRAGNLHNEFASIDLGTGATSYDASSPYLSTHFGIGGVHHISDTTSLDMYSKYFWSQHDSDTASLSSGESVLFHDTASQRLQIGGRMTNTVNSRLSTYWGAAWGQEFVGTARGSSSGFFFGGPTLKGGTAVGELGITWKPIKNVRLFIDVGLQGYMGKREGYGGGLQLRWQRGGGYSRSGCRAE